MKSEAINRAVTGDVMKFSQDEYLAFIMAMAEKPDRELMLKYIQKSVELTGLEQLLKLELRGRYDGQDLTELDEEELLEVWRWIQVCASMFFQEPAANENNVIKLSERRK